MTLPRIVRAGLIALLFATPALAGELRLEVTVDNVMAGTRPWDGTGISSAAVDGDEAPGIGTPGSLLPKIVKRTIGAGVQAGLDQVNARMSPPDPYVCFLRYRGIVHDDCEDRTSRQDMQSFSVAVPDDFATLPIWGFVMMDSDALNPTGGFSDDVIGFAIVIDADTYAKIRAGDSRTLAWVRGRETHFTEYVTRVYGANNTLLLDWVTSGDFEIAKLTTARCAGGCRVGAATVTLRDSVDGW